MCAYLFVALFLFASYERARQHAADRDTSNDAGHADRCSTTPMQATTATPTSTPKAAATRHERTDEIIAQLCGMGMDFDTVSMVVDVLQV